MSLIIREMGAAEADAVADMVRGLALHIGTEFIPKLTGDDLRQARDLIDVVVAEEAGVLFGASLGLMTFSTWRGAKGLYVVDLFVEPRERGRNIGTLLLRNQARRFAEKGAQFIKLEVDETNVGAERFYARLGFAKKAGDRLHVLEQDDLTTFIAMGEDT